MDRYDVIVLGGGLLGSSVAMHLAQRGVKSIAVLDVDLGGRYSSSELNAGGVRATWRSEMNVALSLASIEFYESVRDEVGFDQKGYLWMYDDDHWSEAVDAIKWQNTHGLGVRALTPDQVQQHCPLLDQLDGVAGATFSPRDGLLNPNLVKELYRARARAAAGSGIRFENYSYVVAVDPEPDKVVVRTLKFQEFSPAGDQAIKAILCDAMPPDDAAAVKLTADMVVNCTGAWSRRVAPLYGHVVPVRPVRRQIAIAHARDVDLRPYGMFVDPSGVYFHRESTHILAGWADPNEPEDYGFKYDGEGWFEEKVWPALAGRMSKCASMKHRSGWSGLYEYTPDLCGIIGFAPGHDRVVEALAFTGRGAMQSWAAGRAAAELVTARRYETLDCTPLAPTRFAEGKLVQETLSI
ncbi:MAG TPA: FAD-binding oxidoreductase [Kofleriaceae bacterium]|nr:FAD-binding oxidoreductase [Kofleriaceae bacterium]